MKLFSKTRPIIVDINGISYVMKFRSNPIPVDEERIERIKNSLQKEYGDSCRIAFTDDNCFVVLEEIPEAEILEEPKETLAE